MPTDGNTEKKLTKEEFERMLIKDGEFTLDDGKFFKPYADEEKSGEDRETSK